MANGYPVAFAAFCGLLRQEHLSRELSAMTASAAGEHGPGFSRTQTRCRLLVGAEALPETFDTNRKTSRPRSNSPPFRSSSYI
ncbi:hypothetical protein DFH06DRAFT_1348121 [Mycena polygramma]|nr:hypothetical protein DFH06DRAFT_1348121 [Mycena polygramma]